jgi:hypothetical protein
LGKGFEMNGREILECGIGTGLIDKHRLLANVRSKEKYPDVMKPEGEVRGYFLMSSTFRG